MAPKTKRVTFSKEGYASLVELSSRLQQMKKEFVTPSETLIYLLKFMDELKRQNKEQLLFTYLQETQ